MSSNKTSAENINEIELVALRRDGHVTLPTGTVLSFSDHQLQSFQDAAKRVRDEISHRRNNFRGINTYPENVQNGAEDAEVAITTLKQAIVDLEQIASQLSGVCQ
jgi:hypothetical protein